MSADSIARQPAGTPAGGRFAETSRQESAYVLVTNPPGPETDAKEAVTEAVLELRPDAVSWKVTTTTYTDGYGYDESCVEVRLRDGMTAFIDLSRTYASDALVELSEHERVGRFSELDVTIPEAPAGGWPAVPAPALTAPDDAGLVSVAHRSGAVVNVYVGGDGAIVVDYDTSALPEGTRVRVNVNDGVVYDGDPEVEGNFQPPVDDQVRMEATVTGMVQDAYPDAGGWRVAVVNSPEGHAMSVFIEVHDTAGAPLGVLDNSANPAGRTAVNGLFEHLTAGAVSYRKRLNANDPTNNN